MLKSSALVVIVAVFLAGCSQEPPTVIIEGDNAWQEYAACIDSVTAESADEVIQGLFDNSGSALNVENFPYELTIHNVRAQAAKACAELRPTLITDE